MANLPAKFAQGFPAFLANPKIDFLRAYIRKMDANHTLHVGAADDYEGYSAAVTCQITG